MPREIMCPGRQCAPADNVPRRQFAPGDNMPWRQCVPEGNVPWKENPGRENMPWRKCSLVFKESWGEWNLPVQGIQVEVNIYSDIDCNT